MTLRMPKYTTSAIGQKACMHRKFSVTLKKTRDAKLHHKRKRTESMKVRRYFFYNNPIT